jgi:GNAT superfamily N-acetyltransferase
MSTAPRLTVTQVVEADVADLVPSMLAYARFYGADPSTDDLTAMALAFIATGTGTQLIARDASGEALGHATVLWSWDTTLAQPLAVMEDLFVTAQARGRGVGAALIEACRQLAADRGMHWLAWETAPDNDTAQRLYDGLGAKRDTWYAYRLSTDRPAS